MKTALINGRVFDGHDLHPDMVVVIDGDSVVELVSQQDFSRQVDATLDLQQHILAPGLIDLQVNGGGGVMFNDDPSVATIRRIGKAHRRFGTTGFLPTLVSTDFAVMQQAVAAVSQAIDAGVPGVLGLHLEGPYLNAERRGIHDASKFHDLDEEAFRLIVSLSNGQMLLTLAPERVGQKVISRLTAAGVLVFAGHSAADYTQTREALTAGLRGFTHLFNAMSQFGSREPGMVGAALEDQASWNGIIADGVHVHPASFAVAVAAKQRGNTVLVTDAMAKVGSDNEEFEFDGMSIKVIDGCCRTAEGRLAGSNLDMITAVRNATEYARIDVLEALRMASVYPAHALGLENQYGYIRAGQKASFIEIDDQLNICRSWIDGKVSD